METKYSNIDDLTKWIENCILEAARFSFLYRNSISSENNAWTVSVVSVPEGDVYLVFNDNRIDEKVFTNYFNGKEIITTPFTNKPIKNWIGSRKIQVHHAREFEVSETNYGMKSNAPGFDFANLVPTKWREVKEHTTTEFDKHVLIEDSISAIPKFIIDIKNKIHLNNIFINTCDYVKK